MMGTGTPQGDDWLKILSPYKVSRNEIYLFLNS